MENKKGLLAIIVAIVIALIGMILILDSGDEGGSPTVDENLEANSNSETQLINDQILQGEKMRDITHAHVKPGEYSEVYYTVSNLTPGATFTATLYELEGDDEQLTNSREQEVFVDENGVARFTWDITKYGGYAVADEKLDTGTTLLYTVD